MTKQFFPLWFYCELVWPLRQRSKCHNKMAYTAGRIRSFWLTLPKNVFNSRNKGYETRLSATTNSSALPFHHFSDVAYTSCLNWIMRTCERVPYIQLFAIFVYWDEMQNHFAHASIDSTIFALHIYHRTTGQIPCKFYRFLKKKIC